MRGDRLFIIIKVIILLMTLRLRWSQKRTLMLNFDLIKRRRLVILKLNFIVIWKRRSRIILRCYSRTHIPCSNLRSRAPILWFMHFILKSVITVLFITLRYVPSISPPICLLLCLFKWSVERILWCKYVLDSFFIKISQPNWRLLSLFWKNELFFWLPIDWTFGCKH